MMFHKTPEVENVEDNNLKLEPVKALDLSSLKANGAAAGFLGKVSAEEKGAKMISLDRALELGISHSREYINEKERVFLTGLDLTLAQHQLAPIFSFDGRTSASSDSRAAAMTNIVATNTFHHTHSAGFRMLHRTGARLTADFTQDFLQFLSGNQSINDSALAVTLTQPLLKGGGTQVTMEALTQADRDLLYDLRDFANFRRTFIVGLVSDYYSVLQARDQVQNAWVAYDGFLRNVEREEALAEEDRRTMTELGQLRQATLLAESRWVNSIRNYQSRLDEFKITLGLPVSEKLVLEDKELGKLKIESPGISRDEAVRVALVTRPDLATTADQIEDAERRIKVAKNGLLPGLDVSVRYDAVSNPNTSSAHVNYDRRNWATALDFDLPIDRKQERNQYRAAFIFLERAKRADSLAQDRVRLQIFDDWRAIDQAQRNYEIANQGVVLAARRLEEQKLLAELGKGEARDLVDAQNDLVNAQNQRTSTLVDHTLARLRLWRDMGILYIDNDGGWVKKLQAESFVKR